MAGMKLRAPHPGAVVEAQRQGRRVFGGDAVVAYANGNQELMQLKIDPDVVDPDDIEELEDLVVAAVRAALDAARAMYEEETGRITGGMNLPF